ncbi:MAG: hypothetical protein JSS14_08080 [Proteobacteria bacterium]|nr:hypothetical protein [Pseudomonadota bacterium]
MMNTTAATKTARLPRRVTMSLACLTVTLFCTGALAATPHSQPRKHAPNAVQNSAAPRTSDADADTDNPERFLLLSAAGMSITQTAFASARQCETERKRTLQRNPRLARYVSQGEVDFECVADDAGSELPYVVTIIDKTTGVRADFSMRTQAQCEIGMSHAKAAARRYTILSRCHQRPLGQA